MIAYGYISMIVLSLIDVYVLAIVVYCILTWFPKNGGVVSQIEDALDKIVGPYLRLFRKIMPPMGGIDFSPILAILVLQLIGRVLF